MDNLAKRYQLLCNSSNIHYQLMAFVATIIFMILSNIIKSVMRIEKKSNIILITDMISLTNSNTSYLRVGGKPSLPKSSL